MSQTVRLAVAGIAVAALTVGVAAPAGAQESLGFETNITEGGPGEIVAGQVNTDDVAEHCVTDLEAFQARFGDWVFGPFGGNEEGELFDRVWPDGIPPDAHAENYVQLAWIHTGFTAVGIVDNIQGAAEDAMPQTFVMTFADIATQQPVGELGSFDPDTGEGTVVVPDIDPGFWAVAAACVGPSFDVDTIEAGLQAGAEFLEELGVPLTFLSQEYFDFIEDHTGETGFAAFVAFLQEIGPTLLAPMMVPDAFGAVIFCILDPEGECPSDEVPEVPDDMEAPGPARPVLVQPAFTG